MSLLDSNYAQILLMHESELSPYDWIEAYSQKFRDLIEGGVTNFEEIKFQLYSN